MTVRFDQSLEVLAERIRCSPLGPEALEAGVAVRDASGRLGFFVRTEVDAVVASELRRGLREALGAYARGDRVLVLPDEPGADAVLSDADTQPVDCRAGKVHVLDRRIVGVDWLRPPAVRAAVPPRFAFTSVKGGVGRTTAVVVAAGHLASKGRSVLVVDLDLEAPGIGPLLLADEHLPRFGMVDALVENGLTGLDDEFLTDMVATASVDAFAGRVRVLPALGQAAAEHPENVLAKLARAYTEDVGDTGPLTLLDQVQQIIYACERIQNYDAVFIDARSGLHESTAAAVMGLGAEVFLFGTDERQTFHGYEALFAHLRQFVSDEDDPSSWVDRLNAVQAKAPADHRRARAYAERWEEMVSRVLLPGEDQYEVPSERPVKQPLRVLRNDQFEHFSPLDSPNTLVAPLVEFTFGELTSRIDLAIEVAEDDRADR